MSFTNFSNLMIVGLLAGIYSCKNVPEKKMINKSDSSITKNDSGGPSAQPEIRSLDTAAIVSALKSNPAIQNSSEFEVTNIVSLSTGDKYVVVSANTGTCERIYFLWFGKGNNLIKCAEIEANCDSDLSRAVYRYKTMSQQSDTEFYVEHITQAALDSNLVDKHGHLKNGNSLDDVKCSYDTLSTIITPSFLRTDSVPNWPQLWK